MKKKKTYIYSFLLLLFLAWFLSGFVAVETKNQPIKKITKTNVLYLFGKKRIWSFDKTIEQYNERGKKTREDWYKGERIYWSYTYEYTSFDSLKRITWLTGRDLSPQKITDHTYDENNRLVEISISSVKKKTEEFSLRKRNIFSYDSLGRNYKTEIQNIGKTSIGTTTFIESYTPQNKVSSRIHRSFDSSEYLTTYNYDENGHVTSRFGGLTNDSTYYKTNERGKIIEEYDCANDDCTDRSKFWYDEKGNKVKTVRDVGNGSRTYEFVFDKNNRLVKELRPWLFLGLLRAGVEFEFEYYDGNDG